MAEGPASVTDLIRRSLRPLTDVEQVWAAEKLEDAYAQLVAARPTIHTRLTDTAVPDGFLRLVIQVQCAMVLRVLNNPDGVLEESGDDYTRRLDATVSTGALYATDAELQLLSAGDAQSDSAFTVRSTHATVRGPLWWLGHGTTTL
jgi:hypothetical protein